MSVCRVCSTEFTPRFDHLGYVDVCCNCTAHADCTPRVMGKVAWSSKHTMELEITSNRAEAIAFNKAQRRFGASVMCSLVAPKETPQNSHNYGKRGSGAEGGAIYSSNLREKRSVKR